MSLGIQTHLPQELKISYQPLNAPGKAFIELSLGIGTEAEFQTSWKETENAIEFSGVCPLSNTNSSTVMSQDGCKLKAKNWSNEADSQQSNTLYRLRRQLMHFVNAIVEDGQYAVAHNDRLHTSIKKINYNSSKNLSEKVEMKNSKKDMSEGAHSQSFGDFSDPHRAITNITAIVDGMEQISSTLLEKLILLKSKIRLKTAAFQNDDENSLQFQNLKITIEGIRSYAEKALTELSGDGHPKKNDKITSVSEARHHVFNCLIELMEVKRLLSEVFNECEFRDEKTLTTPNSSNIIDGINSEKMLNTVMYDTEQRPMQIPIDDYSSGEGYSKKYVMSDASYAKLNCIQPNVYEAENSNIEEISQDDVPWKEKSEDMHRSIIYLKNEPKLTIVLGSNANIRQQGLKDGQQLFVAVDEDDKSESDLENQDDVAVFTVGEESTSDTFLREKEIECNCYLRNRQNETADIGCGSADVTVKTVAIGSFAAYDEITSKASNATGNISMKSRQPTETQPDFGDEDVPIPSESKNEYTILITESNVPQNAIVSASDSETSEVEDQVFMGTESYKIPSERGSKNAKEVENESHADSVEDYSTMRESSQSPKWTVNDYDTLAQQEVPSMKICPICLRSVVSAHSIGVGSFSLEDPTACFRSRSSLKHPKSTISENTYDNRTGTALQLDKRRTTVNSLRVEVNENQLPVNRDEERVSEEVCEPSTECMSLRSCSRKTAASCGCSFSCKADSQEFDENQSTAVFQFINDKTSSEVMNEIININISPSPTVPSANTLDDRSTSVQIGLLDQTALPTRDKYQTPFGSLVAADTRNTKQERDVLKMSKNSATPYRPSLRSLPLDEEDVKTIIISKDNAAAEGDSSETETIVWALAKVRILEGSRNEIEFVEPQTIPPGVYIVNGKEINIK